MAVDPSLVIAPCWGKLVNHIIREPWRTSANLSKAQKTKTTQDGRLRDSRRLLLWHLALRNREPPKRSRYIWRAWA